MPKNIQQWIEDYTGYERFQPGLQRIQKVVEHLKLQAASKIITVAGTNGKGECSRLLFQELSKNFKVSVLTSPHLIKINERFMDNAGEISNEKLWQLTQQVHQALEEIKIKLPFFEFIYIVFLLFSKDKEIVIFEVGLGGRLDATNFFGADILLLTSISRDHQEFLGNRYQNIIDEKLGLLRDNQKLYSSLELKYLQSRTQFNLERFKNVQWKDMFILGNTLVSDSFSIRNQKLVQMVLLQEFNQEMNLHDEFPGKVLKINDNECYVMTSHNPDGLRKFIQLMHREQYNFDKIIIFLSDKSEEDTRVKIRIILNAYHEHKDIILCAFKGWKQINPVVLKKMGNEFNLRIADGFSEEIIQFKNKKVLCIGSNYSYLSIHNAQQELCPRR